MSSSWQWRLGADGRDRHHVIGHHVIARVPRRSGDHNRNTVLNNTNDDTEEHP